MRNKPKEINEVLEDIYTDHGISSHDHPTGCDLFFKSLEGSYAYKHRLKVNGILLGDISPDDQYKAGLYEKLVFSSIEGEFYQNYYLPICGWLRDNFIKAMIRKSYSIETCQRISKNLKNVRVGFTYSREDEQGGNEQKDPLGMVRYTFSTKEIDLIVYLHQIIDTCAQMIVSGNDGVNYKNIFIGVLLHELAHLISIETFDPINAQYNQEMIKLRGRELDNLSTEEMFTLATYRSGYAFCFSDETRNEATSINEAITELIAEEWFRLLQQETTLVARDIEYQISYIKEVESFRQALQEYADKTGQEYDVLFKIIKEGYITGGEVLKKAIEEILIPIIKPFDELLERKRLEGLYNIL